MCTYLSPYPVYCVWRMCTYLSPYSVYYVKDVYVLVTLPCVVCVKDVYLLVTVLCVLCKGCVRTCHLALCSVCKWCVRTIVTVPCVCACGVGDVQSSHRCSSLRQRVPQDWADSSCRHYSRWGGELTLTHKRYLRGKNWGLLLTHFVAAWFNFCL